MDFNFKDETALNLYLSEIFVLMLVSYVSFEFPKTNSDTGHLSSLFYGVVMVSLLSSYNNVPVVNISQCIG